MQVYKEQKQKKVIKTNNMRWFNIKRNELIGIELINPIKDKYIIRLSPNNKNIIKDEYDTSDTRYVSIIVNNRPTIADIKKELLSLQKEYDNSSEVNSFYIDGKRIWFDKATRVGIVNAINLQKEFGNNTYIIWFDNISAELDINRALNILAMIENYASICYNVTQKHINEIKKLSSIEECLNYDITADYPTILNITLND